MHPIRQHLTYANVMATVAVFVALGGGAYALGRGDVKSRNIANGAVTRPKLHTGAVTSAKVEEFGLRLHDLGGQIDRGTQTLGSPETLPGHGCVSEQLKFFPAGVSAGFVGSLVTGFVADDQERGSSTISPTSSPR